MDEDRDKAIARRVVDRLTTARGGLRDLIDDEDARRILSDSDQQVVVGLEFILGAKARRVAGRLEG
jgi:hypothetical protein